MRHSRFTAGLLSLLVFLGPNGIPLAWASPSVIIEIFDDHDNPVSQEALRSGVHYIVKAHAIDGAGKSVACNPTFGKNNGVSGDQIGEVTELPNGTADILMGHGFGTAEITVQCQNPELDGASGKLQTNTITELPVHQFNPPATPATPPAAQAPPAAAPAAPAADAAAAGGGGNGALLGVLGAGAIVGGAVLLIGALKPAAAGNCTQPQTACGNNGTPGYLGCCPSGYLYICTAPASVKGCYTSVFITGCTSKDFCTTDY